MKEFKIIFYVIFVLFILGLSVCQVVNNINSAYSLIINFCIGFILGRLLACKITEIIDDKS